MKKCNDGGINYSETYKLKTVFPHSFKGKDYVCGKRNIILCQAHCFCLQEKIESLSQTPEVLKNNSDYSRV